MEIRNYLCWHCFNRRRENKPKGKNIRINIPLNINSEARILDEAKPLVDNTAIRYISLDAMPAGRLDIMAITFAVCCRNMAKTTEISIENAFRMK